MNVRYSENQEVIILKNEESIPTEVYNRPMVLTHQPIRFETSQSWNRGRGHSEDDSGKSFGDNYTLDSYSPKKTK